MFASCRLVVGIIYSVVLLATALSAVTQVTNAIMSG